MAGLLFLNKENSSGFMALAVTLMTKACKSSVDNVYLKTSPFLVFPFPGDAGPGEPPAPPDVTFSLDKDSFVSMFTGKLKPTAAFMQGKLKIKGNMMLAMKLENLMTEVKSKL